MKYLLLVISVFLFTWSFSQEADPVRRSLDFSDPEKLSAPPDSSPGYPSCDLNIDLCDGFRNPPPGYGEVPFWWWSGDPLDKDRLLWQIEELHKKGINGMQVNYIHKDSPGWPTYPAEPEIFSPEWWDMWKFTASEAAQRNMGMGMSGYTLDWPKSNNLFNKLVYSDGEINGVALAVDTVVKVRQKDKITIPLPANTLQVWVYETSSGRIVPGGRSLSSFISGNVLEWTAEGESEVWVYTATKVQGTLNPVHPLSGKTVVEKFFQPFEDNSVNKSADGLNYFFQDELSFGVGDYVWTDDFRDQFLALKGYDLFETLPGLFSDQGALSAKARLDYMDVKVGLSEERYFKPVFDWHWTRGKIYGCDPRGRGLSPGAYGDNFRVQRWYTAPGHDTPGGHADLVKGKVSSSIAALYKRPRVWIEGYHSLGWGATPELLMYATNENFLYGCNLLNLHGLYYTTHGSYWEWAPPCYHFRMPYWDHMPAFLNYFERLSYLLSHGVLQAETAILYPVSTAQARMGEKLSSSIAFDAGKRLFNSGYDFLYVDDQSVARARINDGKIRMADQSFRVLILPALEAIRWTTLLKAYQFYTNGGTVIAAGSLPKFSDHYTGNDPELERMVAEMFGNGQPSVQKHISGGMGIFVKDADQIPEKIRSVYPPFVSSEKARIRYMYRKEGERHIFMVMGAEKDSEVLFRVKAKPEQWDPWTGRTFPVDFHLTGEGTLVRMPLDTAEAQLIIFSPQVVVEEKNNPNYFKDSSEPLVLDGEWEFELKPVLNNRWGDFRLPVTEQVIGAEARRFRYHDSNGSDAKYSSPSFDDSKWDTVTYGFGQKFWKLGPLPDDADVALIERELLSISEPGTSLSVMVNGKAYQWTPYEFSWRLGKEGDPGHQGYHGLKEEISDEFICLGKPENGFNETIYKAESAGANYYLWTTVPVKKVTNVTIDAGGLVPSALYINGIEERLSGKISLSPGRNIVLLRYNSAGRGHFVLIDENADSAKGKTPLSMKWYEMNGRMPFDANPGSTGGWYRFTAPPGLQSLFIRSEAGIKLFVDGKKIPLKTERNGLSAVMNKPVKRNAVVTIKAEAHPGDYGGSFFPEPVLLNCGNGIIETGDWSKGSVLENYSGGAWYRRSVELTPAQSSGRIFIDLGDVVATAEININGRYAGILVTKPWELEITEFIKEGGNSIEILVYNSLSNHYNTIPTKYRGSSLKSGLIGPVKLHFGK